MPDRPNILLLMTDQQRWDTICNRTGCRTPNLNRLAGEGVTFARSYTPVSVCCPARAMLHSGAYGWHNGVFNQIHMPERMQYGMRPDTVTYAMRLQDAGYHTAYVGKWHDDWVRCPLDYGYQRASAPNCYSPECTARGNFRPEDLYRRGQEQKLVEQRVIQWPGGGDWPVWREFDGPIEARHATFIADRGVAMLAEVCEQEQPWLLEVHWPEPHDPFAPHVEFARRYDWRDVPLPANWHTEHTGKPGLNAREAASYDACTEEDVRQAIAHYWAYNEELDAQMGRVLDALEASGQAANTLVVATSDHGELLGNHHMFIKGWMPYEETHRIPAIARWPGRIPAGATASQLVQLHDWAHTFCAAGGADPLPFADGIDLAPVLADPAGAASRDSIMNAWYGGEFLYTQRLLITERYKYVFNGFDVDELYDLATDPGEDVNLIDSPAHQDLAMDLRDQLYAQMHRLEDPYCGSGLYDAGRYLPCRGTWPNYRQRGLKV